MLSVLFMYSTLSLFYLQSECCTPSVIFVLSLLFLFFSTLLYSLYSLSTLYCSPFFTLSSSYSSLFSLSTLSTLLFFILHSLHSLSPLSSPYPVLFVSSLTTVFSLCLDSLSSLNSLDSMTVWTLYVYLCRNQRLARHSCPCLTARAFDDVCRLDATVLLSCQLPSHLTAFLSILHFRVQIQRKDGGTKESWDKDTVAQGVLQS